MLGRLSASNDQGPAYLPDFSGRRLCTAFDGTQHAGHTRRPQQQMTEDRPSSTILVRARQKLGSRFFVSPNSVSELWRQLGYAFPQWHDRLMKAVQDDRNNGVRVYSDRGPRLGIGFHWDDLPTGPSEDTLHAKHLHRFAFAPRHALATREDPSAAECLLATVERWIACAESGRIRWCYDSNLAVIQRLLALSWVWAFVAGNTDEKHHEARMLEWRTLQIIEADIRFLEPRIGKSAPNNHLLTDRFAAWYIHTIFPELLSDPDEQKAERNFRDEVLRQTYPDGGSFEHSMHYHESVCEMAAAYVILCHRAGRTPDSQLEKRTRALLYFQAETSGPGAIPVALGNGSEDPMFPLDPESGWCPAALREIYRTLFDSQVPSAPRDDVTTMRAYWLLGGELKRITTNRSYDTRTVPFYGTGIYVFHDTPQNAHMVFRTGPSPDVHVSPGHMHADMLSIYLQVDGQPMIVDSGTYTYRFRTEENTIQAVPWRQYLTGPAAHNGLAIGREDPLGPLHSDFRQVDRQMRVDTHCRNIEGLSLVDASIERGGVYTNARRICIHIVGEYWLLVDVYPSSGDKKLAAHYGFQFALGTEVEVSGEITTARYRGSSESVTLIGNKGRIAPMLLEGSTNPLGGWVSPCYGNVKQAPQVRFPVGCDKSVSAFLIRGDGSRRHEPTVDVVSVTDDVIGVRITSRESQDLVLYDRTESGGTEIHYDGVIFEGHLLWLRRSGMEAIEYRVIDGNVPRIEGHGERSKVKHGPNNS